jgi:hypothetical protein
MKITVKLFGKPIPIECEPTETIGDLKGKIKSHEKIEVEQQRFVCLKKPLDDDTRTLRECGVGNNAVVYLMVRLFVNEPLLHLPPNKTSQQKTVKFRKFKI